jgi:3-oxoacyl-[acyl-carrier protein] reductase
MSDMLVTNKTVRRIIRTLRLPLPQPQPLERADGPWEDKPLEGRAAVIAAGPGAELTDAVTRAVAGAGAEVRTREAVGGGHVHALVYDATGLDAPEALRDVYDFFHAHVRAVSRCGRILVVARPPEAAEDPLCRSARRAVEGFLRSLGKEVGRKGTTVQVVHVDAGAEDRLEPVLRFLLSKRSAYITAQPIHVCARVPYAPAQRHVQPLEGKVALVTGAARGIGAATARALAREGARVVVMDRPADMAEAEPLAKAIGGSALACDITGADAAEAILAHVNAEHGGLDIVVHNAGITRDKTIANMTAEQWDMVLAVNLTAWVRANEALLPHVRDGGRIVAMSSVGGIAGNPGQTNYGATKAGVIGYVQGLAPRVAERGITVNAVAPGFIETRMTAAMPMMTRQVARRLSNLAQGGLPEDIAEAVTFLASPDAAGLTGEVLRVCGGNFIGA